MTTWETNVTEVVWESQTAPGITWTTVVGGTGGTEIPARRLLPNTVGTPGQTVVVNDAGTAVEYVDAPSGGGSFPTNTNPTTDPPEPVEGASWRPSDSPSLLALAADNKWRGGWLADDGTDQTAETVDPDAITWVSTTAPGTFRFGAGGITMGSLGFWLLEADPRSGSGHPGAVGSVVWSSTVGSWLRKTGAGATAWEIAGGGAALSDDDPAALGVATPGTSDDASRSDHVHPMPTAADVGALDDGAVRSIASGYAADAQAAAISAAASDATTKADAKVADAINDATTTVAPSQNAVFDALALKVPTSRTLAGLDLSTDRTAAAMRSALGLIVVRKSADETVNNSATLQDDDHLSVSVGASKVYRVRAVLGFGGDSTADVKFQLVGPSGSSAVLMVFGPSTGIGSSDTGLVLAGTGIVTVGLATNIAFGCGGSGSGTIRRWSAIIEGTVTTSTTAGTLKLQWAQNAQIPTDTKVFAGSFLDLQEVA